MNKIMLRVPSAGRWDHGHINWLLAIQRFHPEIHIETKWASCFGVAECRNDIVKEFLSSDCTHLWMVDSDVVPPRTTKLLDGIDQFPILAGPYRGYRGEGRILWHVFVKYGEHPYGKPKCYAVKDEVLAGPERYVRVYAAATGCMIIQRQIFEQMEGPYYFKYARWPDGTKSTEDMVFCKEMNDRGIPIIVDAQYPCRHYRDADLDELVKAAKNDAEQRT